jgi:hypothetical protein
MGKIWKTTKAKNNLIKDYFEKTVFSGCNMNLITVSHFDVKVSVWDCSNGNGTLLDLIKILDVISKCDLLNKSFDIWRVETYYDATGDITMDFMINNNELSKLLNLNL